MNGGGSAGGRGTPKAEAQCGSAEETGLTSPAVGRHRTQPSSCLLSSKPRAQALVMAGYPLPTPPKSTTPHTTALSSWGSQRGSRSAAESLGSWRVCPARGSGQGCGGRSPAPRESSLVCGPSTTPAGQDTCGDTRCLMWSTQLQGIAGALCPQASTQAAKAGPLLAACCEAKHLGGHPA